MTLEEKGPIMPPPRLTHFPQKVSEEVQSWAGVISATHWNLYRRSIPDGADFYVGREELGHIHLDGEVHLATGPDLARTLIKSKLAKKFPYGNDWVTTAIRSEEDVAYAVWLFTLNYKRIMGAKMEELVIEINNRKTQG